MAISSVSVDFIANTAKYSQGLDNMSKKTKAWSDNTKKQTQGATDAFEGVSKGLTRLATQVISLVAIQKIGAAFIQVAKDVSNLADEAEKVGASAAQFDKLRLAAERNGSEIGDVKIAYKELQKSINEALGGTKTSIEAFRSLGLSYVALSNQSPDDQFLKIADALSKVEDQNERTRLGLLLLGKAYTELSPVIAKGAAGIQGDGRGSLTNNQIQTIDKVTKKFEEVGRVLDGELKKALVELAPALTVIAKALTFIIENLKTIATVFALAFAPFAIIKFQKSLLSLSGTLLAFIIESRNAANAAKFLGGIDIIKPPSKLVLDSLSSFRLLLIQIASLAGTVSRYFLPLIAYVSATTLQMFDLTEVFFKFLSAATSKGLPQLKKTFSDIAKSVADVKRELLDFVLPDFLRPDKKPFIGPQPLIGPFISPVDAERAGQAYEQGKVDLDRMREIRTLFLKEADDFSKKSSEFGTALGKSMMSPLEELTSALDELDNAFLFGGLEIETYTRKLDELRNSYKRVFTDVVGLTKAPGILEATRGLPEPKVVSKTQLGPLGNLSLLGMDKPTYNTAGEKVFLDLAIQSKFATEDLTKSTLDLQAARERVTKMAPELYDVTRTETELLQTRLDYIKSAISVTDEFGNKIINATVASRALAQAQADLFAVVTPYFREIAGFGQNFADGLANAIVEGQNFGEALRNVFQDILKQIAVLIIRTTILQAIMASIGLVNPVASAAFGKMTGLVPRANGGPVSAGGGYRVGERGPETFIPQTNGYILPNDMAPSETVVVNQTINVQTGVAQTVRAEMASLMPRFKADAMAGVLEAKQRGGSYSRGLSFA